MMKRITCAALSGIVLCVFLGTALQLCAQAGLQAVGKNAAVQDDQLQFVVLISRHGVRSPTGKTDQLNRFSQQPWPKWTVPAGYLTEHGARLMTLFGVYDRELLAAEGLLKPAGCEDAAHIRIVADSDQRTRETGKALAAGLAPGCAIAVREPPIRSFIHWRPGMGSRTDFWLPQQSPAASGPTRRDLRRPTGLSLKRSKKYCAVASSVRSARAQPPLNLSSKYRLRLRRDRATTWWSCALR
jgi:hypothetical protein